MLECEQEELPSQYALTTKHMCWKWHFRFYGSSKAECWKAPAWERGWQGAFGPNLCPKCVGAKRSFSLLLKWGWTCGLAAPFPLLEYFWISVWQGIHIWITALEVSYQYFAEQKALCTALMFLELVLGLARFGVSKTQNSLLKEERGSMVQNCFNVEDGSSIFNVIKSIMLMIICCLHIG